MTGNLRPKSMSSEQAAAYIAEFHGTTETPQPVETGELQQVLNQERYPEETRDEVAIDDEQLAVEVDPELHAPHRADDFAPPRPEADQAQGSETPTLRTMDQLDSDIDMLVGYRALSYSQGQRHDATLRLIEDLIDARRLLDKFDELYLAMVQR